MYCIKCGVRLEDTERKCPLCGTAVYHPDLPRPTAEPLYPARKLPNGGSGRRALSGIIIFFFLIPLFLSLFMDWQMNGRIEWFGYVAGALAVVYVIIALPVWFQKPNPVIFVPCDFAAIALYLFYIAQATDGQWYLGFALPITAAVALIVCAVVTLMYYVGRGKLYIFGAAIMALGLLIFMIELLLDRTFCVAFVGWSVYPLISLLLLGGGMIYLAINSDAREMIERKLFF